MHELGWLIGGLATGFIVGAVYGVRAGRQEGYREGFIAGTDLVCGTLNEVLRHQAQKIPATVVQPPHVSENN